MMTPPNTVLSLWHGHIPIGTTLTGRRGRTISAIIADVAFMHDLSVGDIIGPSRARYVSLARQEAMWSAYQERRTNGMRVYGLQSIGEALGGRDHTTVLHGIRQHEARMKPKVAT